MASSTRPRTTGPIASGRALLLQGARPDGASGGARADEARTDEVVRNSVSSGLWVIVSRVSGLVRVAVIAAVLGPTYFGNTYQTMNMMPNLAYQFLAGTLFSSLLVPPLVRHVDRRQRAGTERFAGGFLGAAMVCFAAIAALAVVAGPLLLRLVTLRVTDPAIALTQRRVGWLLLLLLIPQVVLYGVAGVARAVLNAHGRYALAAAAPALENLGVIVTLGVSGWWFGTGIDVLDVGLEQVLLLGIGTTIAVGAHAAAVCWGARRVGVRLIPRAGWRDPEVLQVMGRAVPSLGFVWLDGLNYLALLVVANGVRGGVVAFQFALYFLWLPVAVAAEPVALALTPTLSRLHRTGDLQGFRDQLVRGAAVASFLVVPAAVGLLVLSRPLAEAVTVGAMATSAGVLLVSASLLALSAGVLGESAFKFATFASYAREDTAAPFRAMLVRTAVTLTLLPLALAFFEGARVLVALGLVVSASSALGAFHLARRLRRSLPPPGERLLPPLLRSAAGAVLMVGPAYLVATNPLPWAGRETARVVAVLSGAGIGLLLFVVLQHRWSSPELRALLSGIRRPRARQSA